MKMERFKLRDGASFPFISSRSNDEVVSCSKLSDKKYRDEARVFLCEGEKLFFEAILFGSPRKIFFCADRADALSERTLELLTDPSISGRVVALSTPAFEKISTEKAPQGVICAVDIPERYAEGGDAVKRALSGCRPTVVLDGVRDPGNVGGILRSAAAFGFSSAVLVSCADPFSPRATRASMGAIFKTEIAAIGSPEEITEEMIPDGRRLVAADLRPDSIKLQSGCFAPGDVPVIGNEGHGISDRMRALCGASVMIPMAEGTESLNAGAAAAVLMWEYSKTFGGE